MLDGAAFERSGFAIVPNVLSGDMVARLIKVVETKAQAESGRGGVRNLLEVPGFRELAESHAVLGLAEAVLGEGAFAVRGILFDKTDTANWKVPWHQDVTIAVAKRREVEGYGPWSMKAGVAHVQPPREVLERMVSVRLHLDDCPAENGALRVIAGTHEAGKLRQEEVDGLVAERDSVTCEVARGGALLMRPLLLHASSASRVPGHRRVIHFDYARVNLEGGLEWMERRGLSKGSNSQRTTGRAPAQVQ